jgi:hypothetical protein
MANTSYVLIDKITVGAAGANTVKFTNIPQTGYTDLVIKHSTRMTEAANSNDISVNFNGVGWNTSVTSKRLYGSGSSFGYDSNAMFGGSNGASSTASTFNNSEIYIANYTSSAYKAYSVDQVSENNATAAYAMLGAQLWSNTSAITSIELRVSGGSNNFVQYSTFYLYGVAKLGTTPTIFPKASGGDTIMTDGTYWYHTFISSGTFTPASALTCDYLVVAGGGGGGSPNSGGGCGGGGAGGLRSTVTATGGGGSLETALSLSYNTAYTVTVGGGGAGYNGSYNKGSNSVFSTITSNGGGAGGGGTTSNGGSGGGTNANQTDPGTGTANQGYAGANGGTGATVAGGGGGGGAGAVGTVGANQAIGSGGAGGSGVAVSITGSSVTYAGGGGGSSENVGYGGSNLIGGVGGSGGGGAGSGVGIDAVNGTANTGGGGGGARQGAGQTPGNGGSGIVIVRYAV